MKKVAIDDALRVLDVDRDASWDEIRSTYRERIRLAHPDLGGGETTNDATISLNAAYAALVAATRNGKEPLPIPEPVQDAEFESTSVVRFAEVTDPFDVILDASHDVGDVIYVSEDEGLIQVLIDAGKRSESILLVQIDNSIQPVQVLFTLELQSGDHPLDLVELVKQFGDFEQV